MCSSLIQTKSLNLGLFVSRDKAENQASVAGMVNQERIQVPKVYDWAEDIKAWGCLVMGFMDGEREDALLRIYIRDHTR